MNLYVYASSDYLQVYVLSDYLQVYVLSDYALLLMLFVSLVTVYPDCIPAFPTVADSPFENCSVARKLGVMHNMLNTNADLDIDICWL